MFVWKEVQMNLTKEQKQALDDVAGAMALIVIAYVGMVILAVWG